MKLLLDTHVLLWVVAEESRRLPTPIRALIQDQDNQLFFSAISIWEVAIKGGLGRSDFIADPFLLRRNLLEHDYRELAATGHHAAAVSMLPPIHKDPFDRILIAQAQVEGLTFLTADKVVARYPGPIQRIRFTSS